MAWVSQFDRKFTRVEEGRKWVSLFDRLVFLPVRSLLFVLISFSKAVIWVSVCASWVSIAVLLV